MPEEVLPKNSSHIQFNKPIVGVWFSLVHFVPGKNLLTGYWNWNCLRRWQDYASLGADSNFTCSTF